MNKLMITNFLKRNVFNLLVTFILSLTFLVYYPGLTGDFIFDDNINLKNIIVFNNFDGIEAFIRYILSNEAGVLKRPISTLSFLLNSTIWPTNAYSFKLTNVFIHLTNGFLLYLVTFKMLIQLDRTNKDAHIISVLSMSIWILNPFFVSTTLYVVQRMSMLPVTFILFGIYLYLKAREVIVDDYKKGVLILFFAIPLFTVLAVLSKENGVILPILLLMIEFILASQPNNIKLNFRIKLFFLIIPTFIIILAFIYKTPDFIEGFNIREYSVYERLLTQSRVILSYLYHLFAPQYLTESVYTDGVIISKSIFEPISTLLSIITITTMFLTSIILRKKFPLYSIAILFYFISLFIESTIIPLEMYFEHRSYLPSLFIFLPLSSILMKLTKITKVIYIAILVIIVYISFTTYLRTNLWSNNVKLNVVTSQKFPQSVRALNRYVSNLYTSGHTETAISILNGYIKSHDNIMLWLNRINLKCSNNTAENYDFDKLIEHINKTKITKDDLNSLIAVFVILIEDSCIDNGLYYYEKIIKAITNNEGYNNPIVVSTLKYHEAYLRLKQGKYQESLNLFHKYLEVYHPFESIIYVSKQLITLKKYDLADKLLKDLLVILEDKKYKYTVSDYKSDTKILLNQINKFKKKSIK